MHDLFKQVLDHKDLSKAGELFSVDDHEVVGDLTNVLSRIQDIATASDYLHNDNDQSVTEICITRVTSAIRETGTIEDNAQALVQLLKCCLNHDLKPSSRDEDPPHAKVAADIISCIFLNYNKREVMRLALPVTVKFLHKGNRELCRNLSSYLSLAAINNAELLSKHIQPIIDSIISGNYGLARVLPQIYSVKKEQINDHVMTLISLLPRCENSEKLSLINLFGLIAKNKPSLLETNLPQLSECLTIPVTASAVLNVFIDMVSANPHAFMEYVQKLKNTLEVEPSTLKSVCRILGGIGLVNQDKAKECLAFMVQHLEDVDLATLPVLLQNIKNIMDQYPSFLPTHITKINGCNNESMSSASARMYLQQLKTDYSNYIKRSNVNQTSRGVTIVKVGGKTSPVGTFSVAPSHSSAISSNSTMTTNAVSLFNSGGHSSNSQAAVVRHRHFSSVGMHKSMPKLGSSSNNGVNKSMTKLTTFSAVPLPMNRSAARFGSSNLIHKSMSRLSSSSSHSNSTVNRSMNALHLLKQITSNNNNSHPSQPIDRVSSGGVTVMANDHLNQSAGAVSSKSTNGSMSILLEEDHHAKKISNTNSVITVSIKNSPIRNHAQNNIELVNSHCIASHRACRSPTDSLVTSIHAEPVQTNTRGTNTSVTVITASPSSPSSNPHSPLHPNQNRISVFEPYPMRDAVQHFCEKHLQKIKAYMQKVFVKLPLPVKCTIEERRSKKFAKLQFACQGRGEHCLYSKTFFIMITKNPKIWIHLMFLALQARANTALSQREQSVSSLKTCWDILKYDNKSFLTLVTSAFPSAKDQETLMYDLRDERFFDVFEYNGPEKHWGCFLCNHPDRAMGFLQDGHPVIEGQLKEKKGKWKLFKRWRTRYFTLSGLHLSYKISDNEKHVHPINVSQIRSVKAVSSKGPRSIPKAFEVFTNDKTYVLKAKDSKNAEQWVQCLSIAVARSHSSKNTVK